MLAGIRIVKFPKGIKILFDKIEMTTTTDGIHQVLDEETKEGIIERIKK
jgi:hypothetical protein